MTVAARPRQLVVLDRDGVINHESEAFIKSPGEWKPIDGSLDAIARLSQHGFTVAVATNQSGIGRGLFDRRDLYAIHRKMRRALCARGGRIDRVLCCPHAPGDRCTCRKPLPGLLERLGRHYNMSMRGVPVVGDSHRDLEAARAAGARAVLVLTGNGRRTLAELSARGVAVEHYDDLRAAAEALIREQGAD